MVIAFIALLLATSAVPVLAAERPGGPPEEVAPPLLPDDFNPSALPDADDVTDALKKAEREETEREVWLASPKAIQEREESRLAFAALDESAVRDLLNNVFSEQLAQLNADPARTLSDSHLLKTNGETSAAIEDDGNNVILESTLPVRVEDEQGDLRKVNVNLEETESGFETANALVDVQIPETADEPVVVGDAGVAIELVGADEEPLAQPFGDGNTLALDVLPDTDMVVSPIATGVEIFNLLRSENSPETLRYEVSMPVGAELRADGEWGAEIIKEGELLNVIPEPVAIDAQGTDVPVDLRVEGDFLVLTVDHREGDYAMPILLDPQVLENNQNWIYGENHDALDQGLWAYTNNGSWWFYGSTYCIYECFGPGGTSTRGLYVSLEGQRSYGANQFGQWSYSAPNNDSYISSVTLGAPYVHADHNCSEQQYPQPHNYFGVWSKQGFWVYVSVNSANQPGGTYTLPFAGDAVIFGLGTGGGISWIPCWRDLYAGGAHIWLDDWDQPILTTISSGQWMDASPVRLNVRASDKGLGVRKFEAEATNKYGAAQKWETWHSCAGTRRSPCPGTWNLAEASQPQLAYEPAALPEGIINLNVTAFDATLRKSATTNTMTARVDHAAPTIKLSGTITEQATLGTDRRKYTIRVDASDGVPNDPDPANARSGVVSISEWIDGKLMNEYKPGCSTQSCSWADEGAIDAAAYSQGKHTLVAKATDALGHVATKQLDFALSDKLSPALNVTGLPAESPAMPKRSVYWKTFGVNGTADGQLKTPADVTVDSQGDLWVADRGNNRIQKFSSSGQFLMKFGSAGTGNGQFNSPASIAIDPQGNLWVADKGNGRVQKFNSKGEYLAQFGSKGTGNGQFTSGGPEGIAIDPKGNIWVSDTYAGRVQKFNESGTFLKVVSSKGSGAGQLGEPTGIDVGPDGRVWVTDWAYNRVVVFNEAGEFVKQFGSTGSGNGQFNQPDAIAIGSRGDVWVGDQNNGRIQEFDQNGTYLGQFGSKGSGPGQFNFAYPMGIVTDSKGSLWIADTNNNRVQRWLIPNTTVTGYLEPLNGAATDSGYGVTSVTFKLANQAGEITTLGGGSQTCSAGGCPLSYKLSELDLSSRPSGTYLLSAIAVDGAGNSREVSRVLNIDTTPPELKLSGALAESAGGPLAASSAELAIDASDVDPTSGGVREIKVERDGQLVASFPSNCSSDCHDVAASYLFRTATDGASRAIKPIAPSGNGAIGELRRIACITAGNCWAVGRTKYTIGELAEGKVVEQLLEHWGGSEWQTTVIPKPEGASSITVEDISCAAANSCLAVGSYSNGTTQPLVERWDGSKWTASTAALPAGATKGSLYSVSCSAASDCWAYGKTQVTVAEINEGKAAISFFSHWTGGSWQSEAMGKAPDGSATTVTSISCTSTTTCTAVGRYTNPQAATLPFAYTRDASGWRFQPMAIRTEANNSSLEGISCTGANQCASVGYSRAGSAQWRGLAEAETPDGGPHEITIEAVDVQGNAATESIEIDVDPTVNSAPQCNTEPDLEAAKGVLTPGQAVGAIEKALPEAVAPTEGATAASTEELVDPTFSPPSPNLQTVNSLATGETSVPPEGGFTLGDSVCVTPATLTPAATDATVVGGDAALFANTSAETDTVIRPTALGATVIRTLRGPNAPDEFAWHVTVEPGQDLVELPSGGVAVVEATSAANDVAQVPLAPKKDPDDITDVEVQVENGEYQLINAADETELEVVAVFAQPWIVLYQGGIVPAMIEVVPDIETPNEFEVWVKLSMSPEEAAVWPVQLISDMASASSVNGTCSAAESPCGWLDIDRATQYAMYWANEAHHYARNPYYADYGSNNCTNFISQVLHAGGGRFMRAFDKGDGSWWYRNLSSGGIFGDGPSAGWEDTNSWRQADMLPRHLWRFGLADIDQIQEPWGWTRGNIIALDWIDTDGKGNVNHLQFVVGTDGTSSSREPLIANSSSTGSNYPHKRWQTVKERIAEAHGSSWGRFSLSAKHRIANLNAKKHDPDNLYSSNGLFNG